MKSRNSAQEYFSWVASPEGSSDGSRCMARFREATRHILFLNEASVRLLQYPIPEVKQILILEQQILEDAFLVKQKELKKKEKKKENETEKWSSVLRTPDLYIELENGGVYAFDIIHDGRIGHLESLILDRLLPFLLDSSAPGSQEPLIWKWDEKDVGPVLHVRFRPNPAGCFDTEGTFERFPRIERFPSVPCQVAMEAFARSLPEETVRCMKRIDARDTRIYNLCVGANPTMRKYRLQFLEIFPFFSQFFFNVDESEKSPGLLRSAVDTWKSPIPILERIFETDKDTLKKLQKIPFEYISEFAYFPWRLFQLLAVIDGKIPQSKEDWEAFILFAHELNPLEPGYNSMGYSLRKLLFRLFAQNGFSKSMKRLEKMRYPLYELNDALDFLRPCHALIIENHLEQTWKRDRSQMTENRFFDFLETRNVFSLLEASKRWHRYLAMKDTEGWIEGWAAVDAASEEDNSLYSQGWKGVTSETLRYGDYIVVPLNSSSLLAREWAIQWHCVGGYSACCLLSGSLIFSIRTASWKIISTLEVGFAPKWELYEPKIVQNRGERNQYPESIAQEIANSLTREFAKPWYAPKIIEWMKSCQKRRNRNNLSDQSGTWYMFQYHAIALEDQADFLQIMGRFVSEKELLDGVLGNESVGKVESNHMDIHEFIRKTREKIARFFQRKKVGQE